MVMNKKGQVLIFTIMLAMFAFVCAVIMIAPLKEMITTARGADYLDCANDSISTGTAATCLIVDIYLPYFIAAVIFAGFGAITYTLSSRQT